MNQGSNLENVIETLSDADFDEISTSTTKNWRSRVELGAFIFAVLGLSVFSAVAIPNLLVAYFTDTFTIRIFSAILAIAILYFVPRIIALDYVISFFTRRSLIRELNKRGLM
jgi:hypothetical protein